MFSYFPKGINDTKPQQVIDIEVCKLLIQNNIKKDVIQNIWSLEYRSSVYTKTKALLPYITPHGTFLKNREDACLDKFSGLLYFDVDGVVINIELYKSQLIQKYKKYIYMMGKSVGGRGIFFYLKIKNTEDLSIQNFSSIYEYYCTEVFKDIKIDTCAKGISRAQFIPYDNNLYFNDDAEVYIPYTLLLNKSNTSITEKCATQYNKSTSMDVLSCSAHSFRYLDINEIIKDLKTKPFVDVGTEEFIIQPVKWLEVFVPRVIQEGNRHRTYKAIISAIVFNNPDFTLQQVGSFINFINTHTTNGNPLPQKELIRTFTQFYNKLKQEGVKEEKIKWVHTNPNLSSDRRSLIANRENSILKVNMSVELIKKCVQCLEHENIKPTIKKVSEILTHYKGDKAYYRSERTIQKYWRIINPKVSTT